MHCFAPEPRSLPSGATASLFRVLDIIHELLLCNKHATKRDIYYMDVTLFCKQDVVDRSLENIAAMLRVPRTALHVMGTEKSLVAGNVCWKENGDLINCMDYLDMVAKAHALAPPLSLILLRIRENPFLVTLAVSRIYKPKPDFC